MMMMMIIRMQFFTNYYHQKGLLVITYEYVPTTLPSCKQIGLVSCSERTFLCRDIHYNTRC